MAAQTTAMVFREQVVLGGAEFLAALRAQLGGDAQEQRGARRLLKERPGFGAVKAAIEQVKGSRWADFRDKYGDTGRDMALYLGRPLCGMKLRELADAVELGNYGVVATNTRRYERRLEWDRAEKLRLKQVVKLLNCESFTSRRQAVPSSRPALPYPAPRMNVAPLSPDPDAGARHDDAYVQALFDRMGPSYGVMNLLSSFGFSELWRRRCVQNAGIRPGARVCDLMAGSGECWGYIRRRGGRVVSVDFSRVMIERQRARNRRLEWNVEVLCENALQTSLAAESIDCVVGAFGLKTLSPEQWRRFALEIRRVLKPGGVFSLLEISAAEGWWLGPLYRWYLRNVIPRLGRLCLADIECYRMLGVYTAGFGSCARVAPIFAEAGLRTSLHNHFFGCATSLVGTKPAG